MFNDDRKVGRVLFDACCVRFANVCMEVKNSGNVGLCVRVCRVCWPAWAYEHCQWVRCLVNTVQGVQLTKANVHDPVSVQDKGNSLRGSLCKYINFVIRILLTSLSFVE